MKNTLIFVLSIVSMLIAVLWQIFFVKSTSWYLVAVIILILSMMPFFFSYERKKVSSRDLTLTATLIGLAVVSRAVFYLIPQVKPIGAVVIVAGATLGYNRGYIVGVFSAFLSNFIFGQGIHTPFQMVGLGLVGLFAGLIFSNIKATRISLAVYGFLSCTVLYGVIVDTSTVLLTVTQFNFLSVITVYGAGMLFDLIFGISTAVFLFLFGVEFKKKIDRVITKYGILENVDRIKTL